MRSTNEILIAVQECGSCTDEELRLCIMSMGTMLYFGHLAADDLAATICDPLGNAKVEAATWVNGTKGRFEAWKMPMDEYLGPSGMPGTPEHAERLALSKADAGLHVIPK